MENKLIRPTMAYGMNECNAIMEHECAIIDNENNIPHETKRHLMLLIRMILTIIVKSFQKNRRKDNGIQWKR